MTMEIFVSCVGDLATLGGSVGRSVGPATHLVRFLFFSVFFVVVREALGDGKFYSGSSLSL